MAVSVQSFAMSALDDDVISLSFLVKPFAMNFGYMAITFLELNNDVCRDLIKMFAKYQQHYPKPKWTPN